MSGTRFRPPPQGAVNPITGTMDPSYRTGLFAQALQNFQSPSTPPGATAPNAPAQPPVVTPPVSTGENPSGEGLNTSVGGVPLPLNKDGTVRLYHATKNRDAARRIVAEKMLRSEAEPSVYLSTAHSGTGYGDHVVAVDVHPKHLQLDDEFSDGRADFRIDNKSKAVPIANAYHLTGRSSQTGKGS